MATVTLEAQKSGAEIFNDEATLIRVFPPRYGDFNLQGFMNVLESLDIVEESISFEIVAMKGRVEMYVRSVWADHVVTTLLAHYPYMRFEPVSREQDPMLVVDEDENCWRQVLWPSGDDWLPFQVYDEQGLLEHSSDPFIDMIGGMSGEIQPGGRVISRLVLSQKDHGWSEAWRNRAIRTSGVENQMEMNKLRVTESTVKRSSEDSEMELAMQPIYVVFFALIAAAVAYASYFWVWPMLQDGMLMELVWMAVVAVVSLIALAVVVVLVLRKFGVFKPKPEPKFYDTDLVRLRVEGSAFRMEIQIYAVLKEDRSESEAVDRLLRPTIAAYRSFDNPLGMSLCS